MPSNKISKKPLTLILLGRSGCGKGTQAQLLVKDFGFEYIGTGEILRLWSKKTSTFSGRKLGAIIESGHLAPTFLLPRIWMEVLEKLKVSQSIIFDGSPRTYLEAKLLDEALRWHDRGEYKAVLIDISKKEAAKRLVERGRDDDVSESIKSRLNFFEKEVKPAIAFFKKQGKLITIFGERPIEEIHDDIVRKLNLKK